MQIRFLKICTCSVSECTQRHKFKKIKNGLNITYHRYICPDFILNSTKNLKNTSQNFTKTSQNFTKTSQKYRKFYINFQNMLVNKSRTNMIDIRRIVVIRVHIVVSVTEIRIVGNRYMRTFIS